MTGKATRHDARLPKPGATALSRILQQASSNRALLEPFARASGPGLP